MQLKCCTFSLLQQHCSPVLSSHAFQSKKICLVDNVFHQRCKIEEVLASFTERTPTETPVPSNNNNDHVHLSYPSYAFLPQLLTISELVVKQMDGPFIYDCSILQSMPLPSQFQKSFTDGGEVGMILAQYVCISDSNIKQEPPDVLVVLSPLHPNGIVLPKLIVAIHPSHELVQTADFMYRINPQLFA